MVRKPALELIGYLKKADPAHPSVRYVLCGERGTGKSLSLCHAASSLQPAGLAHPARPWRSPVGEELQGADGLLLSQGSL
ncbi:28S ribosomal protein S29, mitochondrial-like [Acipenser oxyrinchus oxyrinchus]|uniref:Small ribosomal subunit protein mS29 n=1 Tax=Acipenser oxyrinchus oxyrinchus TaxID=40147 RepID=A0AAD8CGF8_ACIOX|nr:28S ribosomal protein S29, mitochondrial-like [Acipenser oxyrinchus oxyrinchus]